MTENRSTGRFGSSDDHRTYELPLLCSQEAHRFVAMERRERDRFMSNKEREAENARNMEICRQQVTWPLLYVGKRNGGENTAIDEPDGRFTPRRLSFSG